MGDIPKEIHMKNSAVKAMVANQYPNVELSDINVTFDIFIEGSYEFVVSLIENNEFKQFKVVVKMEENQK